MTYGGVDRDTKATRSSDMTYGEGGLDRDTKVIKPGITGIKSSYTGK